MGGGVSVICMVSVRLIVRPGFFNLFVMHYMAVGGGVGECV